MHGPQDACQVNPRHSHARLTATWQSLQIARIACCTVACPAGLFAVDEEGGVAKAEEWDPLPARELASSANWTHRWAPQHTD